MNEQEERELLKETARRFKMEKQEDGYRWQLVCAEWIGDKFVCTMHGSPTMRRRQGKVEVYLKNGVLYPYFGEK